MGSIRGLGRPTSYGKRKHIVTSVVLVLALFAYFLWQESRIGYPLVTSQFQSLQSRRVKFWRRLDSLLYQYAPNCPEPDLPEPAGSLFFDPINNAPRRELIVNTDKLLEPLQQKHHGFVQNIRNILPYRPYIPKSRGIVSSAGGDYIPTFMVSLRVIRARGLTLPVELILKDLTEYEPYACKVALPALNAKCVVLTEALGVESIDIAHFQLKSFAILFSSFEEVVWMDSDCLIINDPAVALDSKPFTETGYVLWPDYWANTASPLYYTISRQQEPPMTARQSTDSSIILVSKKTHLSSLILACYYNYHGPSHYYRLLGQGQPGGDGDKNTFLHAASAMGNDFYAVSELVTPIGRQNPDGYIFGVGMLGADPVGDYENTSQGKWRVKEPYAGPVPLAFYINANNPKFNPAGNLLGPSSHDDDGTPTRLWTGSKEALQRFGYDVERVAWEQTKAVACEFEEVFESWKEISVCEQVQRYWDTVFENLSADTPKFTMD